MFPSAKLASSTLDEAESSTSNSKNDLDWLNLGSFQHGLVENVKYQVESSDESSITEERLERDRSSSESPVHVPHKKKKKKEKHRHKKKKNKNRSPETYSKSQSEKREIIFKGNKIFIEEIPGLEFKDAYRLDRKSDINTWNYGSLYKGHISKYHDNVNDCMGRTKYVQVSMKENKKNKTSETLRYCSKENRKLLLSLTSECVFPTCKFTDLTQSEIITVQEPSCHSNTVDVRERLLDDATSLYLQGKCKESQVDQTTVTVENSIFQKTVAEFNKKTRENPHDVDTWIQFVEFQDKLTLEDCSNMKLPESSILDKKISVLKKAMEHNPANIKLRLQYFDLCKGTMSSETVVKEMEQLLFIHPTNILLWKQYILYHQSSVSIFSVSRVCKVYQRCFSKLFGYLEGQLHTHTSSSNLHKDILDLFVQYCYFLKQVGQMERAVASFQAVIEFNLYCPEILRGQHEEKVVVFESFWDSGVPRVGETGAKGWNYWFTNKKYELAPKPFSSVNLEGREKEIVQNEKEKWKVWLQIELERQAAHWLPWRPDISLNQTEEDCEDLDRLVLFDDISNILIPVSSSLFIDMVTLFLQFLGVDVAKDSPIQPCSLDNLKSLIKNKEILVNDIEDYGWRLEKWENFISCFIDQMIDRFDGESKTLFIINKMYFQFHLCENESKKVNKFKKFAKSILREDNNRNKLSLWCTYCDILKKCGFQNEAVTVIETALSMGLDSIQKYERLKMYIMLTEIYLRFDEKSDTNTFDLLKAQNVLICFMEDKTDLKNTADVTATSILRSRNKLEVLCDTSMGDLTDQDKLKKLSRKDLKYLCDTFRLLSLFEYSFGKHELELAVSVLEDAIKHLYSCIQDSKIDQEATEKVKFVMENLFHFSIRLAKHHMTINTAPLSVLRNIVQHAMKVLPEISYFLQTFIDIELKTYISGRLDRYFSHMIRSCDSPVPVIFAVYSILCRQLVINRQLQNPDKVSRGGMINRIRSYLERALQKSTISQCPLVWRMYLHSEVQFDNKERAQGIFYRALQSCPWSKALYLDAVSLFNGEKVEEIIDLMTEKELRLQIPLEEVDILLEETEDIK